MNAISDPIERHVTMLQINSFGQTPAQLFSTAHPPRMVSVDPSVFGAIYSAPQRLGDPVLIRAPASSLGDADDCREEWATTNLHGVGDIICYGADEAAPKVVAVGKFRTFLPHSRPDAVSRRALAKTAPGHIIGWGCFPDRSLRVYAAADIDNPSARAVTIWDATRFLSNDATVTACVASRDGTLVLTGSSDTTITMWETNSRRNIVGVGAGSLDFALSRHMYGHTAKVTTIELCRPYSAAVSGDAFGAVIIWDLKSSRPVHELQPFGKLDGSAARTVKSVVINHTSGDVVAATSEYADDGTSRGMINVWSINGRPIATRLASFTGVLNSHVQL
eukprot:SAG31_NODE_3513_length_4171_cov_2.135527_1_plen_334_part_00